LAALPWLTLFNPEEMKPRLRRPIFWGSALGAVLGAGLILAILLTTVQAREGLEQVGRIFGAVLHVQLMADLLVAAFALLLLVWPKGGAVALAAFRESLRQPMFWLIGGGGVALMALSTFLPYFTFGEDYLMVKELGFDIVMLCPVLFGVLNASISVYEEIEGRTAITLMSKPVSRRQFLIGKYVGVLLAAFVMTGLMGLLFPLVLIYKHWYERMDPVPFPPELTAFLNHILPSIEAPEFYRAIGMWFFQAGEVLPGLILGFCQVMVLLAIAVALATRLPMVVNVPVCLLVYFLGHLTPVLVQVSTPRPGTNPNDVPVFKKMVSFVAQVFDTILPGLQFFTLGPAVISDTPLATRDLIDYVSRSLGYAMLYTLIVLLFGLVLFEDRDLA